MVLPPGERAARKYTGHGVTGLANGPPLLSLDTFPAIKEIAGEFVSSYGASKERRIERLRDRDPLGGRRVQSM